MSDIGIFQRSVEGQGGDAAPGARETFRALAVQRARPGQETALWDHLVIECHRARACSGFVGLTLAHSMDHPGGFLVLSRWKDRMSLSRCLIARAGRDNTAAITALCDTTSLDVLVPTDPPGAAMPTPGVGGGLFVSRVALPQTQHVQAAREVMDTRTRLVRTAPGCLWVMGNLHADRSEFLYSCSGWESRAAWDAAQPDMLVPDAWTTIGGMLDTVTFDLMKPLLELGPDGGVSAPGAPAHP